MIARQQPRLCVAGKLWHSGANGGHRLAGINKLWFDGFVARTRGEVHAYLRRFLNSSDDILEVAQEAYLKVYVALLRPAREDHAPRALLFTTARNLAISRLRHEQVVSRSCVAVSVQHELNAQQSNPERQARDRENLSCLLSIIDTLPPRCRTVIWLRIAEGLSQKEIAARMEIATSTVEKHLARGLVLCRAAIAERDRARSDSNLGATA